VPLFCGLGPNKRVLHIIRIPPQTTGTLIAARYRPLE
jgi:hypothetical protein